MHRNFLFDLDQTLLDFHASERKALEIVVKSNGMNFSEDTYAHFKAYNKSLWLELEKGTITRTELFIKRFNDLFALCNGSDLNLDPLKVNADFIHTMSVNGVLMDGALSFIKKLKEDIPGSRIYIISNGATVNAEGRIRSTGLDEYIDHLFISESMGVCKPSTEFFDMVFAEITEPKESSIVIGDSLTSDMLGARNYGLCSVWFMPEGDISDAVKTYEIDYVASSFDGLLEVLKKWSES